MCSLFIYCGRPWTVKSLQKKKRRKQIEKGPLLCVLHIYMHLTYINVCDKRCLWHYIILRWNFKGARQPLKWCVLLLYSNRCPEATRQCGLTDRTKINDLWQLQRARIRTVLLQPLHNWKQLLFQQRLWFLTVTVLIEAWLERGPPVTNKQAKLLCGAAGFVPS